MVFTDAEMPEMDGYRLTTEIRKDTPFARPLCGDAYLAFQVALTPQW